MPTLQFKGKPLVQNHHLVVPFSELEPMKSRGLSKTPSLQDNLIIEGDNLKALKALLPAYHGKVKCIYIDPPYNTGNEGWIYNDRVNSPMMRHDYFVQGWLPNRIYADFIFTTARDAAEEKQIDRVFVVETKGKHLAGVKDVEGKLTATGYKRDVSTICTDMSKQ